MTSELPLVSLLIPCRNEEDFIQKCLDSIVANDYPKDKVEILVIDGMSTDKTRTIINEFISANKFIKLIDNPRKFVSIALNIGIKNAGAKIIIIMGAHTVYASNYISKCVSYLLQEKADCVGGVCSAYSKEEGYTANAIASVLSSSFGVGNSYFRTGSKELKEVDTVPFGCYRKEVFDKIGLFNEKLIRNQDIEFNLRLKKAGGKILLSPDIVSYYMARSSFKDFLTNNFLNGLWNIYTTRIASIKLSLRHYIPLLFVGAIILFAILAIFLPVFKWLLGLLLIVYFISAFIESIKISMKKGFQYLFALPFVFFGLHLCYGLGSLCGVLTIWRNFSVDSV